MADHRPDPETLLARVKAEEAQQARGKLKIFFGAAPGVGKTYAMLEAARKVAKEGVDVLVGYVEPHVRPETQALVLGLDILPRREVEYRGAKLLEFDLEAALKAHPQLMLVDELAHTNAPGVMHAKRWQDVEALLAAGINVYTTLNVQHLESINDIVAQITGVIVRETVPDAVFEGADEIELVDLAPDDLIERLREGKVYLAEQAGRAINNYFKKGNLIALRELALRRTAERVNAQMESYRAANAVIRPWPTSERLLVSVGPSPHSARLVRAARRMATTLRAPWVAVHVETPLDARLSTADADRLAQTMHLAEELGAETVTISGTNLVDDLLEFAHRRNVSKIVVGKPLLPRWKELLRGSFVYELTRKSGDIDIYVISGDFESPGPPTAQPTPRTTVRWGYHWALLIVAICTGIGWLMTPAFSLANIVMVYLLGVVAVASRLGHGPSILASILSVAAFDFVFVPPQWTFAVADTEYLVTFAVMLATGLLISTLTTRLRMQADAAQHREQRTSALFAMSRQLVEADTIGDLVALAVKHVGSAFDCDVHLLFPDATRKRVMPFVAAAASATSELNEHDIGVAQWVYDNGERAGRGTDTLPSALSLFVPLRTPNGIVGILGIRPKHSTGVHTFSSDQLRLLETFGSLLALTEERIRSATEAHLALVQVNTERMRNSLLSAVSHDLRTPLTTITGASSALLDNDTVLSDDARRELAESIYDESERLNRLVANLLDMTRLEAGALRPNIELNSIEEMVGVVLNRMNRELQHHSLVARLPSDLPLVPCDGLLVEQLLTNLIENAIKWTPAETEVDLSARVVGGDLQIEVADRGPGFAAGEEQRIFEKFYRSLASQRRAGVGLGLPICRAIANLHGGKIWAENRPGGGAMFRFTLPLKVGQPLSPGLSR